MSAADIERTFVCDCMCCGAAKCLRAWGYYSYWKYGITDADLVAMAIERNMTAVTGDSGIMKRNVITKGRIEAVYIPVGLDKWEQLGIIVKELHIPRLVPRCMHCGGSLTMIDKERFRDEIPPRTYRWLDTFFRCSGCGRILWQGTHWDAVSKKLDGVEEERVP